ncbi:hypothetical protein SPI_03917 [Niveomyces insectorum RCEF 264]|uniref:PhoD-like phosphatase domain-containing protein n=1 Tax=Niveomyces insectorum RCEF 264 TaxID=1081102 RepID=A0A167WGA9_9HYPO|nr:hypothetical protein SPI_03917 [Niveomyces insectorum RCEF 264]
MTSNTPYWGHLPDPKAAQQAVSGRLLPDSSLMPAAHRPSLDTAAQPQPEPKPNRVSVQTTNTDAPTESTTSPFVSPISSNFPDYGLALRPPSLPYGVNQHPPHLPPQETADQTPRRGRRNNHSHDEYTRRSISGGSQEPYGTSNTASPLPAAPDVPKGPHLGDKRPYGNAPHYAYPPKTTYATPQTPRTARRPDLSLVTDPMDLDRSEQYYTTASATTLNTAQAGDNQPQVAHRSVEARSTSSRARRSSVSASARPPVAGRQQSSATTSTYASEAQNLQRRVSTGGNHTDGHKKLDAIRSPLQKLELTLDSITKEEKRARVAAAEQIARERAESASQKQQQYSQQSRPQLQPLVRSAPQHRTQPQSQHQLQQKPPPQQQQVRFREQAVPIGEGDPRPLLQPEMSPVEESYIPVAAHRGPLSQNPPNHLPLPPPDSEKPHNRQGHGVPSISAAPSRGPGPSIPQRNLSFRERAAQNDIRFPRTEDSPLASPDQPAATVVPHRRNSGQSAKLKKDPPGDPWYNRRIDAEKKYSVVQPRSQPTSSNVPGTDTHTPQQPRVPKQDNASFPPGTGAAKLLKSPHGKHVPDAFASPGPSFPVSPAVNSVQVDDGRNNKPVRIPDEASVAGAVSAASARAIAAPPSRRAARFENSDHGGTSEPRDGGALNSTEQRHFDDPHQHRLSNMLYHPRKNLQPGQGTYNPPVYLDEWKKGNVGTLMGDLLDLTKEPSSPPVDKVNNKAWWETRGGRRDSTSTRPRRAEAFDGEYDMANGPSRFKPPLHLVCGPLLRYCGIRKERSSNRGARNGVVNGNSEHDIWRGSVMIVTRDTDSSYDIKPTLRLFIQPLELLPPPPSEVQGVLPPEYIDPLVGHPKLGRNGETLYVRPVEHLEEAKDLSRDETDSGLFEKTKSAGNSSGPKSSIVDPPGSFAARLKKTEIDGETTGKFKDVRGFRLHAERGVTFWRFNIEVELVNHQQRIAYRINRGPSTGFWVPAKDRSMHIMFHTCNGFSLSVDSDQFSGPDPLWRDVLNTHQTQPFHVMIGGGDQLYNDAVMQQTTLFQDWLMIRNPITKSNALFTPDMQNELEGFYLARYSMWFSQGLFSLANSQIPMVNMYDDHDIIDGYGSYPHHFMNSPVFSGIGNVAFKYYMLFQHQSVIGETEESEPSWILGSNPGPYINEVSHSLFMHLGTKVALLAVDCRTERTRDEVLHEETWKRIIDRCYAEIEKGKTEHLLVLLGVPIAYPRLVWLENILTSRLMEPIKALGKTGIFGNFLNHFDGGVEVLDDLDDHWTSRDHKDERKVVVEDLQDLAADKSVRVTIISGDVHLAAIGQFYSNPKQGLVKHKDFRYMPNVISSAIANAPPPDILADILNKRNKVHHFDRETDEDMIPLFAHGVEGKPRNNKRLLPHRNWCSIQPYAPGATPASTPNRSAYDVTSAHTTSGKNGKTVTGNSLRRRTPHLGSDPTRPPLSGGILRTLSQGYGSSDFSRRSNGSGTGARRSFSLSRDLRPATLFRRLSNRSQYRRRPDDGGINGSWGPDSAEALPQQQYREHREQEQQQGGSAAPFKVSIGHDIGQERNPNSQGRGHSETVAGARQETTIAAAGHASDGQSVTSSEENDFATTGSGVVPARIRGGAGSSSDLAIGAHSFAEFQNGDENYFSVKRLPTCSRTEPGAQVSRSLDTMGSNETQDPPPRLFYRTPTGLTSKQMKRAQDFEVNLEGGLDIRLNVEVSPRDPAGITVPYRLVVPRLWYTYEGEDAAAAVAAASGGTSGSTSIKRLFSRRKKTPAVDEA